ncbi:MAG: hypothetical protein K0R06_796 [Clostridium sp.]|jgi:DNA-binding winged helix-turn-helix (wHTH) protein|nr:hypothetical protein [Clostridium sp.]
MKMRLLKFILQHAWNEVLVNKEVLKQKWENIIMDEGYILLKYKIKQIVDW